MKDERGGKIIMEFATTAPKTFYYRVQKDDHEIECSVSLKAERVKKSTSKELTDLNEYTI